MAASAVNPRLLPGGDVYEAGIARGEVPWILRNDPKAAAIRQRLGILPDPAGGWMWDGNVEAAAGGATATEDELVAAAVDLADVDDLATADPALSNAAASGAGAAPIVPANALITPFGTIAVGTGTAVAVGVIAVAALLLLRRR